MAVQALISACEKGGRLDQALKAYADMLEAGMQPDMITYSNLLTGADTQHIDTDQMFCVCQHVVGFDGPLENV